MSDEVIEKIKLPKSGTDENGHTWTEEEVKITYNGLYRGIHYAIDGAKSATSTSWYYHAGTRGYGPAATYQDCVNRIKEIIDFSEAAEAKAKERWRKDRP